MPPERSAPDSVAAVIAAYEPGSRPDEVAAVMARWRPSSLSEEVAGFARSMVERDAPETPARAKALLYAAGKLGAFCGSRGLELRVEDCVTTSVIERYIATDGALLSAPTRHTVRSNLRALCRALGTGPAPMPLSRQRSKAPYSAGELAGYLALADAQPTLARSRRLSGLGCLGAGAGLMGADLRGVRGTHVVERSGGVVVEVMGPRPRVVPVLSRYWARLVASAAFAKAGYVTCGRSADRRTVTTPLVSSVARGADLASLTQPSAATKDLASSSSQ